MKWYPFEDEAKNEIYLKNYIEWQKAFVSGDQHSCASTIDGKTDDEYKQFYWQDDKVFNLIKATVDRWATEYDAEILWGPNKAVDQLIPYQKQYNSLMNKINDISFRLAYPILCVEDGSIDCDELNEEGLAPGKILVYRQGGKMPELIKESGADVTALYTVALGIKAELLQLMDDLEENFE